MRIPVLIAMAILISASPAMAKSKDTNKNSPVFGKYSCRPTFSCSALEDPETLSRIEEKALSIANSCVSRRFLSDRTGNGFFVEGYGLNSSLCFKSKRQQKAKNGLAMTPKCCIKPARKKGMCEVQCMLIGKR